MNRTQKQGRARQKAFVTATHRARFLTRSIDRAPENRSEARFLGRGGAALQVEHFTVRQNAGSIGERRRGRNDKDASPVRLRGIENAPQGNLAGRKRAEAPMDGGRRMRLFGFCLCAVLCKGGQVFLFALCSGRMTLTANTSPSTETDIVPPYFSATMRMLLTPKPG